MYINFFKSAISDKIERIETKPQKIKDIEELKDIDFQHTLIYVNGFLKDENYKLRENDVCTIRYFPADGGGGLEMPNWFDAAAAFFTGGLSVVWQSIRDVTATVDAMSKKLIETTSDIMKQMFNIKSEPKVVQYIDDSDKRTYVTQVIDSKNAVKSPDMRGCTNKLGEGKPYPLVLGKSYFVPDMIAKPYITPADDYGTRQTFHALYNLGYNGINVTNISLGLKELASNVAKQRNGSIVIDGYYNQQEYDIHLEIQESAEVSLYNQKVVQQDINVELVYPKPVEGEPAPVPPNLRYEAISTPYPQKVEVEVYFDALVGKITSGDNKGKDKEGTVKVKIEYSTDGGNTYKPFGKIGNVSGISYDASTGETTFTMKKYNSMRFVATKDFNATAESRAEILNATNHVIELRIQRTNVHDEDEYIYDTVSLAGIRTYCYDPSQSSTSGLVAQSPICAKDRQRITRLGFTITSNDKLSNIGEFNCIVQALGRTCTESDGYYTWSSQLSETCNPASMVLRTLQCGMLGEYVYSDSEIDMQKFGEFYKFCNEYDINDARGNHVGICANGVVTKSTKLSDLVSKILAVGRASRILANGKLSIFIDKQISYTSLILNNQNVLKASNTKDFNELPSGIKAEFINEDNYNQDDVMYIDYADAPERSSIHYKTQTVRFEFQTNVEQIKKNGLYELAKLKLRPETWNRTVLSEGSLAYIGAKIEIQDDTIAVGIGDGAEIKEVVIEDDYITGIKTDGEFDVTDTTQEYGVEIQVATLTHGIVVLKRKVVISQAGVYRNFTFDSPISLFDTVLPASGDILSFGVFSKITYESICIGKKPNGDGSFDLTLIPYVEAVYNADAGTLPDFESNTTAPSYAEPLKIKDPLTQEDLQDVKNNLIDLENGSAQIGNPDTPSGLIAIAEEKGIQVIWQPVFDNGLNNTIKNYTVEISKDSGTNWTELIKTGGSDYFYTFTRTGTGADGYPEASVFATWKFRVKAENLYGNESDYAVTQSINTNSYNTWIPCHCIVAVPKAQKDGFRVTWNKNGSNYGTDYYRVKVYDGVTLLQTSPFIADTFYEYKFDRSIDGYPEKSTFSNTRNLNNYIVKIEHSNESPVNATEDSVYINADEYGTWRIGSFSTSNITKEVIDRTVIFGFSATSGNNLELYGETRYKVSIKRTGIDEVHEGNINYPSFTPDTDWYKPDLYSNPLASETSYKTSDVDGYEISSRRYSQTLPLVGQSTSNLVNTIYEYRISAYNESGFETASQTVSVTALCTSIRDIVKANADYKDLYVEKLSALSANIGLIAQGGMGDFASNSNYWALSTLFPEDTGLERTVHEGEFRVGDSDSFIKVSYDEHGHATVEFSTDAFTVRAENTEFNKSIIIQESPTSLDRTRLTPIGTYYEHRNTVNSNWVVISKIDTAGARTSNVFTDDTMIITNASMKQRRINGSDLGLPLPEDSLVYHFDDDMFDQYGNNSLTITPETGGIEPRLVGIEDVSTSQSITSFIPALQAVAPFATSAKSLYGNASVSKALGTINVFTIEFWIKHSWNESQVLFTLGNQDDNISLHLVNAEAYYNEPSVDEVPYNEATIESEVTPYNEIVESYAKLEYNDYGEVTIYDLRDYGVDYKKDEWFHLALVRNNSLFKFVVDTTDIQINSSLLYSDDIELNINPTKGLFLLDELMISESAVDVADIKANTVNKIPYGKLDYTRKHFILDVDNSDVWTNLFDTQIFKDKVLEVIREENSGS